MFEPAERAGAVCIEPIQEDLKARLRECRDEIEQAALIRVGAVSDPSDTADPEYLDGLRAAVSAAVDYGLESLGREEDRLPPIPAALLSQARLAARNRVKLEVVLRRYLAGYTLLGDFLVDSSIEAGRVDSGSLKRLMHLHSRALDRLLAAVSDEYEAEVESIHRSTGGRLLQRVERLLAGESVDTADLGYELDGFHLGLIASGFAAEKALAELAAAVDCWQLIIDRDEQTKWAWLGSRGGIDPAAIQRVSVDQPVSIAVGEPGRGVGGWRLTHHQARAALPIAQARGCASTRYRDVALLASVHQDQVLCTSLRHLYLDPLAYAGDGGAVLRETLRAYFATRRNVSSAAAALGVNRRTVTNRLHAVEERLGRAFQDCSTDLELALQLEDLAADRYET